MSEETQQQPEESKPVESKELPRDDKGRFVSKEKKEPLYSKRNPESSDRTGTFSAMLTDYRDTLLEGMDIELPEDFEKESLRSQIKILKYMRASNTSTKEPDVQPAQPLDKTATPNRGGEHPALTTSSVKTIAELNRADKMLTELREKSGFRQIRKRMTERT